MKLYTKHIRGEKRQKKTEEEKLQKIMDDFLFSENGYAKCHNITYFWFTDVDIK